jgi:hypothetical protein
MFFYHRLSCATAQNLLREALFGLNENKKAKKALRDFNLDMAFLAFLSESDSCI